MTWKTFLRKLEAANREINFHVAILPMRAAQMLIDTKSSKLFLLRGAETVDLLKPVGRASTAVKLKPLDVIDLISWLMLKSPHQQAVLAFMAFDFASCGNSTLEKLINYSLDFRFIAPWGDEQATLAAINFNGNAARCCSCCRDDKSSQALRASTSVRESFCRHLIIFSVTCTPSRSRANLSRFYLVSGVYELLMFALHTFLWRWWW